jgi:hypothetical protein
MLGVDPEFWTSILRLWVAAASAVLLVLFCLLAFFQPQLRLVASPTRRIGFVLVGVVLGAAMTWAFLDRNASGDRGAERRAIEMRAAQLSAQALAPGSPLACLDAISGETVEAACERALFASPASVAAASSYVALRLALLASATAYADRGATDLDNVLVPLRRAVEADRYGFLAHVLAVRDGCSGQNCKALALLRDPSRVRDNLGAATLDRYLDRHAALWSATSETPVAEAAPPASSAAASNGQPPHRPVNIDFPSAASIPAVSIMNTEPTGPVVPGAAAAAAANPNAQSAPASRRARKPAANPEPAAAAPPAPSGMTAVEPIWPEPVPPPPQAAPVPAAASPMPLSPPAANANAGAASRAQ